jgi:3-hydroxy-9,10-secoandrosta-1,3,5(10)-triene-9,17-dione monooxygenase reductase component
VIRAGDALPCVRQLPGSRGQALRGVMGHVLTGVTVVTGLADGVPVGMTVNSFTSVSLDPPLVLFCARTASRKGARIRGSGAFAVNVLAREHAPVAQRFARGVEEGFSVLDVTFGSTGSPILADSLAFVECRIVEELERGDHTIVIGEVVETAVLRQAAPLAFFRGRYLSVHGEP